MTNQESVRYVNRTYPGYGFFDVPDWIKISGNARVAPPSDWTDPITGKTVYGARAKPPTANRLIGNKHHNKPVVVKRGETIVHRYASRNEAARAVGRHPNTLGCWIKTKRVVNGLRYEYEDKRWQKKSGKK